MGEGNNQTTACRVYRVNYAEPDYMLSSVKKTDLYPSSVSDRVIEMQAKAKKYSAGYSDTIKGNKRNGQAVDFFIMCSHGPNTDDARYIKATDRPVVLDVTCFAGEDKVATLTRYSISSADPNKIIPSWARDWYNYSIAKPYSRRTLSEGRGSFYQTVKNNFGESNWHMAKKVARVFDPGYKEEVYLTEYRSTDESDQHSTFVQAMASRVLLALNKKFSGDINLITVEMGRLYAMAKSTRTSDYNKRLWLKSNIESYGANIRFDQGVVGNPEAEICVGK